MGNTSGKIDEEHALRVGSFNDLSGHAGQLTEREASSAWYRYGVSVTDVYDVVEVLGQGHMGEVFTVRRKTTGHHTALTRETMRESEVDLKLMLERAEEAEARQSKRTSIMRRVPSTGGIPDLMMRRSSSAGGNPVPIMTRSTSFAGRPSFRGAAHKAKKVIRGGKGGGRGLHDDADSNLAPFIRTDDDHEFDSQHKPPRTTTATPLKSIMRKADSFEGGERGHGRAESDGALDTPGVWSEGGPSSPLFRRSDSAISAVDIERSRKGVHFQRTFAVKTILTSRINKDQLQELVNEIMIMRKLDHPFVLKLYEVYHIKRKLWLVTELLTGGDLSSRKLNERDAKNVVEQVLRALVYLHRMGIVHRDIKLENVLYENHGGRATVRLIDFGLSRTFDRTSVAADYARTPYTMSPETAASKVDEEMTDKMDVWAVGVITFIMLSGEFPFIKTNEDCKDPVKMGRLKKGDLHFGITWSGRRITGNAKEFVKGCLQADPNKRWTAKQALQNLQKGWAPEVDKIWDAWLADTKKKKKPEYEPPQDSPPDDEDQNIEVENGDDGSSSNSSSGSSWLAENNEEPPPSYDVQARAKYIKTHVQELVKKKRAEGPIDVNESASINMDDVERYTKSGLMRKTILITMANTMDRGDVGKLQELFLKSDTEDTGTITLKELVASFREVSPEVDEKRVEELFFGIDRDKSGHIHFAEFLAALAESHGLVTLDRLSEAFDRIDTDGKGFITHEDLKSILGKDYDKETVDSMIEEGDFKKNNKIDYEELLQLMFSDPVKGDELAGSVSLSPIVSFGDDQYA